MTTVVPLLEAFFILRAKEKLGDRAASVDNIYCRTDLVNLEMQASSSNGRASDSKSGGWGFESLLACHFLCLNLGR